MRGKGTKLRMAQTLAILVLIVPMMVAVGCSRRGQSDADQSAGNVTESGGEGTESGGEGSESGGEGSGEGGGESGGEGSGESGDPSSPILALDESWDGVVNGVRTAMSYDPVPAWSEISRVFKAIDH